MLIKRPVQLLLLLGLLLAPCIVAPGDYASLDPDVAAAEDEEDDVEDSSHVEDAAAAAEDDDADDRHFWGARRHVEGFDFDPSQGLTFYVAADSSACFYQDVKFLKVAGSGDKDEELRGAYVVSAADSRIDVEVKDPEGGTVLRQSGKAESEYVVVLKRTGVYELCFRNVNEDGKLVTHVTNTLQSQHPIGKEHVSGLAKYASDLDLRLGELESEQRLQLIRTDRHAKEMNKRVVFYGALECAVYLMVCFCQVYYIKSLLESPQKARSWV
uniref:GOLD domain-containing protein n=1 Tax=Hyaloperonospora arabidopsidis (strain Emoy2) TaxID=559515 RepID=M4C536_HYAAE